MQKHEKPVRAPRKVLKQCIPTNFAIADAMRIVLPRNSTAGMKRKARGHFLEPHSDLLLRFWGAASILVCRGCDGGDVPRGTKPQN